MTRQLDLEFTHTAGKDQVTWLGRPIEELSKEDLIAALRFAAGKNALLQKLLGARTFTQEGENV